MPLAISNILWPETVDGEALRLARAEGADGIEVAPTRIAPWEELTPDLAWAYRRRLEGEGLRIPSLQAILYGRADCQLLGPQDSFARLRDHLEHVADIAEALGATRLVFGAPKYRLRGALPPQEAFRLAAERLAPLAALMGARGLALVLEAVAPAFGCDFITTTMEAAALVRAVGHPGLRLHLDMGTLLTAGESASKVVAEQGALLAHVHVSRPGLAPLSESAEDAPLDSALATMGYQGWISLEIGPQPEPLATLAAGLRFARRAFARTLQAGETGNERAVVSVHCG